MPRYINDIHHDTEQRLALAYAEIASNTTTAGVIIDTKDYEALEFILTSAIITDGAYAVSLQEGNESNLSDAAVVSAELILGNADFALADDDTVKRVGYIGKKRYVRLSIVSTAVTTGGFFTAAALLAGAHHMPVAD